MPSQPQGFSLGSCSIKDTAAGAQAFLPAGVASRYIQAGQLAAKARLRVSFAGGGKFATRFLERLEESPLRATFVAVDLSALLLLAGHLMIACRTSQQDHRQHVRAQTRDVGKGAGFLQPAGANFCPLSLHCRGPD